MKRTLALLIVFCLCICLCGCESSLQRPTEEFGIVTTVFPAYDFARNIAGNRLPVYLLVPPGAESHSFEPAAQDIMLLENWFLVCNGGESEVWLEEFTEGESMKVQPLYMMDCVETVTEELKEGMQQLPHSHSEDEHCEHEEHEHEEHDHGDEMEFDEHVWTSPANAVLICREICRRLCELDSENSDYYMANTDTYCEKLLELDSRFRQLTENSSCRTLIFADRFPVRYFVEEYELDYFAAFPGCSDQAEPSARTVAFLIDKVREDSIPAVFHIEFSNEKMADIICEDTGCKKLLFHSCHNVSAEDFKSGISYLELMEQNYESLKEALA